ncbi:tRNA methyltransferase 10 homolog C [Ctenopharyngodon idella]|uniref:tRNA methyltransferase 10 homolog C n=1 Tax=Ctenopharyngodon idella TaxID=7959 RepID=UPI002232BAEC|nr:tRNA methyltransferase 10 homolog C [Ctenopharyngodon idella]
MVIQACSCVMFLRSCSLAVRRSCTSAPLQTLLTIRPISTTWTARKDAAEKLDLDIWKSVMKSQPLHDEDPSPSPSALDVNRELVEMWHQAGKFVPKNITDEQLEDLAALTTKSAKRKYLKFLAIKEAHKISKKEKRDKKKSERDTDAETEEREKLKNTFLMKFWNSSMDRLQNWRAAQAMRFGQPLVYDMSYEQHMTQREMENTVSQLLETEGWNRRAADPFHLHFCSLQPGGAYHRKLLKRYGTETWERLLITATARRPIDVFPPEDLVYLTADSRNVLRTFDHRKVYVVGAMVDRSIHSGVSLANAKRLKLATARLPLDEYLDWDSGAKNLTLDQMIRILATVKDTGSWKEALEFVPKRKHCGFHQRQKTGAFVRTVKTQSVRDEPAARGQKNKTDGHKRKER